MLTLRQRFKRAEVRYFYARTGAQSFFWLMCGYMTSARRPFDVALYGLIGLLGAVAESRLTPRLRRLTRVMANRWGLACFNGSDTFTLRYRGQTRALRTAIGTSLRKVLSRGAPILRTPVEALHSHGQWMFLQGEMVSLDVDRTKVELGGRYVVSLRALGTSESVPDLPKLRD
jgi:hypothetical protein